MAIADVYDALISARPYKNALTHEKAVRIIFEGSGTHFDPLLIEAFDKVFDTFHAVTRECADEEPDLTQMGAY